MPAEDRNPGPQPAPEDDDIFFFGPVSSRPQKSWKPPDDHRARQRKDGRAYFEKEAPLVIEEEVEIDYDRLAPPDGLSPAERLMLGAPRPAEVEEAVPERPLTQFTIIEMMWLVTFLSMGMAVLYYLPPAKVAGVMGILALVGLVVLMRFPPENRHVKISVWLLLGMYALASLVAWVQHLMGA
jgi:hypothetical protein